MPRKPTALRVFVASPNDVDDERRQLEDVVSELNTTWCDTLNVRLDLLTWRDRAVPGAGVDAQDVINRSMPQDYDIFMGIMWSRFGIPTARAGSGTEEEFNRALERSRAEPGTVHLMMYFKADPVPMSRIEPEQLARVLEFQKRLEGEGILYAKFTSPFEATVRVHLALYIQSWIAAHPPGATTENDTIDRAVANSASEPEEHGLIDSADMFLSHMSAFGEARSKITAAVIDLHRAVIEQGPEMHRTSGMPDVRKLMNWRAELLEALVRRLSVEIPAMSQSFESAMDNLGRTIALAGEVGLGDPMESPNWESALTQASDTLNSDIDMLSSFRSTIANTGRFTTRLNRAKRTALAEIDRLLESYRHQAETFAEVAARRDRPRLP